MPLAHCMEGRLVLEPHAARVRRRLSLSHRFARSPLRSVTASLGHRVARSPSRSVSDWAAHPIMVYDSAAAVL
jgi:hypothetical protein